MPRAPKIISALQQILGRENVLTLRCRSFTVHLLLAMAAFAFTTLAAENPPEFLWATPCGETKGLESCGLTTDQNGDIFVTGIMGLKQHQSIGTHGWSRSGGEVFLAKFDSTGKKLWLQTAGGNGTDNGIGVASDNANNVYVTGYFSGTVKFGALKLEAIEDRKTRGQSPPDIFLAKYSPDGKPLWVQQAGGAQLDQTYGVATDKKGNVYVTGYFQGLATFGTVKLQSRSQPDGYHDPDPDYGDMFLAKYNAEGQLQWVRQAGKSGKSVACSIAADDLGNIYLAGSFNSREKTNAISFGEIKVISTDLDGFIAKYDTDGKILWAQPTAGDQYYHYNQIAVDATGHAFIAGNFRFSDEFASLARINRSGRNSDIFLAKYDTDGKILWCKLAGGQAVESLGLAVDQSGNAVVTGVFDETATFDNIQIHAKTHDPRISGYESFLAHYSPDGEVIWVKTIDRNVDLRAIAMDKNGIPSVTGTFHLPITLDHLKLTPPTNFLKEHLFDERTTDVFVTKLRNQ
jgi:hypothetical protein